MVVIFENQGEVLFKNKKNTFIPNGMRCTNTPRFHPNCRYKPATLKDITVLPVHSSLCLLLWGYPCCFAAFFHQPKALCRSLTVRTCPCRRFNKQYIIIIIFFCQYFNGYSHITNLLHKRCTICIN